MSHKVEFVASGRGKARSAPDPVYPKGKVVTLDHEVKMCCKVELPYPAPECGWFKVECEECGLSVLVSAAGRPDDPVSVELPCEEKRA